MKNKIVFGRWETTTVLLNSMGTQIMLGFPRNMVELAGTAGWMLCVYITVLALVFFYIISKLYKPFEGLDPLDLGEMLGGGIVRIIVGLLLMTHAIFIISMVLREFGENMKAVAFPTSPISFVQTFFVIGMILGAYIGLEAIVRIHSVVVPIITFGVIILIIGIIPFFNLSNLLPVFGNGLMNIYGKGFFRVSSFSALIILFLIYPFIKSYKVFKTSGYWGLLSTGFFMTLVTVVYSGVMSYPVSTENLLPLFHLSRMISLERFFQRIESIFLLTWAAAALLYLSTVFYIILMLFKKTFRLEYHKPLIFPFVIIIFTISLLPPNIMMVFNFEAFFFRSAAWLTTFLLTILLLISARFVLKHKARSKA